MKTTVQSILFLFISTILWQTAGAASSTGSQCSVIFSEQDSQLDVLINYYFPQKRRNTRPSLDREEFRRIVESSFRELDPLYLNLKKGDLVLLFSGETVVHGMVYLGLNQAWHRPPGSDSFGTFTYGLSQFDLLDVYDPTTHSYRYYRPTKGFKFSGARRMRDEIHEFVERLRDGEFGY